ncbi:MAG: hypothetical protein ACOYXY_07460 [Thermodesulfobacteriota bacterium]
MRSVFFLSGIAVCAIILFLGRKTDSDSTVIFNILFTMVIMSRLIAWPILRRRIAPPCIRAKETNQSRILAIITALVVTPLWVYVTILDVQLSPSFERIVTSAVVTATMIIAIGFALFGRIQIWGNGVWEFGWLSPWEEYESFSWERKTEDSLELRLVPKSWIRLSTRLMVAREDQEAVQRVLEENLPDLNAIEMNA